jgi:hypothetical protein
VQQTYEFHIAAQGPVLQQYMEARGRNTFIMGPIGSGKTYGSAMRVFDQMCEQKPNNSGIRRSRWVAVRNTYPDLKGTTIKDWCDLYHNEDIRLGKFNMDFPPTHHLDFDLPDGPRVVSELVFLALDRPDSVRKLRGLQVTGFWLNEVKELSKAIVDMCDGRHGRYPSAADGGPSWHGMIGDTNAPDTDHWYYELAEEVKPKGWTFLRQQGGVIERVTGTGVNRKSEWLVNPNAENLCNLPDGYYVNQVQGKKDDWIRVNLANMYGNVSDGKPIYQGSWNDLKHVSKYPLVALPRFGDLRLGFDFGRTPACIIGQVQKNGKIRVVKELIATGMGIRKFMDEIVMPCLKKEFKKFDLKDIEAYGDPAGIAKSGNDENSPIGILNDEYNLTTYPTATNTPLRRWESVASFLDNDIDGSPAFELGGDCHVLRKGFNGGYQFRRLNVTGEKYSEVADKNAYSHPHDALQYLCQGAQGEINYNWRDKHVDASAYKQAVVADSVTGY